MGKPRFFGVGSSSSRFQSSMLRMLRRRIRSFRVSFLDGASTWVWIGRPPRPSPGWVVVRTQVRTMGSSVSIGSTHHVHWEPPWRPELLIRGPGEDLGSRISFGAPSNELIYKAEELQKSLFQCTESSLPVNGNMNMPKTYPPTRCGAWISCSLHLLWLNRSLHQVHAESSEGSRRRGLLQAFFGP